MITYRRPSLTMTRNVLVLLLLLNGLYVNGSDGVTDHVENDIVLLEVAGVLREVSPYYLSVTLSSLIVQDGVIEELANSPRFVTLARGLSPAIVRVGGTPANFLTYDSTPHLRQESQGPTKRRFGKPESRIIEENESYEVTAFENFTMNAEDFLNLKNFAKDAGYRILFDLNQFYRTPEGTWDATNALEVIRDGDDNFLWQLGNEPNSYYYNYKYNFTGTMDAADFKLLKKELTKYYEEPIIVGPDVTNPRHRQKAPGMAGEIEDENSIVMKFLDEFLAHLDVDISAITWHQYYLPGTNVSVADFTSLETLDMLTWQIPQAVALRDKYRPGIPIWLTETSSSFGGGAEGLSNAYVAGFLWLDKLGLSAVMGIDLLARQTLFSKRYALIGPDYVPYPDYWLSLIFKQLVGNEVLDILMVESHNTTRLYGHCQKKTAQSYEPGNVVIYGVNVDFSKSAIVKLVGMPPEHTIDQYLLEAPNGDLQSREVMLNGELLQMTSDEQLPEILPLSLPHQEFVIPSASFGFWVIRKTNVLDCM